MDVSDIQQCLTLHSIPGLSDSQLSKLLRHYGGVRELYESSPSAWLAFGVSKDAIAAACSTLRRKNTSAEIEAQLAALDACRARVVTLNDVDYPALLLKVYDPPPFLYLRGDITLLQKPQIAVVGSRKASPAGLRAARTLSAQLSRAGLAICSGLALGIDGQAHRAALEAGGGSVAVMATGIDRIYPVRHRSLAEQLAHHGCLVTEYPPGCKPERYRFPRRNRILSGLSLGVLVVEAALRSGSLITAGTALEQGREVFALPWSMFHEGGRGCLRLIRDGAKLVEGIEDILEELGPLYSLQQGLFDVSTGEADLSEGNSPDMQRIVDMIGYETITIDELVRHSSLPVARLMATLSALELQGSITRSGSGYIHC